MKNNSSHYIVLSAVVCVLCAYADCYCGDNAQKVMPFIIAKNDSWSLREDFVALLADTFDADLFIESGTGRGATTSAAAHYFKHVYTIESREDVYDRVAKIFSDNHAVTVLQGDFPLVISVLASQVRNKKIIFWLDGNYGEADDASIMRELAAIKKARITDAVILIDDIHCFALPGQEPVKGYPSLSEVKGAIKDINDAYELYTYGDIIMAFTPSERVRMCPVVQAMTASIFTPDVHDKDYQQLIAMEYRLTETLLEPEKAAIKELMTAHVGTPWGIYPYLWHGLVLLGEGKKEAFGYFVHVLELGQTDIRVYWYCQASLEKNVKTIKNLYPLVEKNDSWLTTLRKYIDDRLPQLLKMQWYH